MARSTCADCLEKVKDGTICKCQTKKVNSSIIILPLPPSINATYKTNLKGNFYKSSDAKDWEEEVLWLLKKQWKKPPLTGKVEIYIHFYFKRESDLSNRLKILEDILQQHGVYKNDSQIYKETIEKHFDKQNPHCEIEVKLLS